jgi:hypothetical protein
MEIANLSRIKNGIPPVFNQMQRDMILSFFEDTTNFIHAKSLTGIEGQWIYYDKTDHYYPAKILVFTKDKCQISFGSFSSLSLDENIFNIYNKEIFIDKENILRSLQKNISGFDSSDLFKLRDSDLGDEPLQRIVESESEKKNRIFFAKQKL